MKQRTIPTEAQEQESLFRWIAYMMVRFPELELLFHIPNGGSRDPREAHNLRMQGVRAGVPDLMLPVARGKWHGLFIEMKRQDGGRMSAEQKAWAAKLMEHGYLAVVCRGWIAAANVIKEYLGITEE